MKKTTAVFAAILCIAPVLSYSQENNSTAVETENQNTEENKTYKINNVYYISTGKTKPYALERSITIDKNTAFSLEDFEKYCQALEQKFRNTRLLEQVQITKEYLDEADGVIPVNITVLVSDSKHLLALPKVSYNSNDGGEIKVKLKDMNFLGFMNTLNFDFNAQFKQEVETDPVELALGANFQYDFPFKAFNYFNNTWSNSVSFSWTLGSSLPEFNVGTGLTFGVPIGEDSLDFTFQQYVIRDEDYDKYGDACYGKEYAAISYPLVVGKINKVNNVTYTPSISFTYNWDFDGIDPTNTDLSSPVLSVNQNMATSGVNWNGNFRTGYDASISQAFGWNYQTEKFVPYIAANLKLYKDFKYIGFNTQLYGFGRLNDSEKIGGYLRGIRDNQYFTGTSDYALKVPAAIIFNFDMPVHVITTHWLDWGCKMFGPYSEMSSVKQKIFWLPHKIFSYCDFELQISPFVDAALVHQPQKEETLKPQDGWYAGGVEVLVYPTRWKSFVVRGSVGFDLGRIAMSNYLDMTYRDTSFPPYEIFFGLGLQY